MAVVVVINWFSRHDVLGPSAMVVMAVVVFVVELSTVGMHMQKWMSSMGAMVWC